MAKYIPLDALVAEIERRRSKNAKNKLNLAASFEDNYLLSFLDTLEVKELDLEKEIDLDTVIDAYMDKNFGEPWDGARPVGSFELAIMAEHFFELGLKAQKGE